MCGLALRTEDRFQTMDAFQTAVMSDVGGQAPVVRAPATPHPSSIVPPNQNSQSNHARVNVTQPPSTAQKVANSFSLIYKVVSGIFAIIAVILVIVYYGGGYDKQSSSSEQPASEYSTDTGNSNSVTPQSAETSGEPMDSYAGEDGSTQQYYLDKLDGIDYDISQSRTGYDSMSTYELQDATGNEHQQWDTALNEIWAQLENDMPSDDFERLRLEQRDWLKTRDQSAEAAAADYAGGTGANAAYNSTTAEVTKNRCYELVKNYM
jgi:hypothetical protein